MYDFYLVLESYFSFTVSRKIFNERMAWEEYEKSSESNQFVELLGFKNGIAESLAKNW